MCHISLASCVLTSHQDHGHITSTTKSPRFRSREEIQSVCCMSIDMPFHVLLTRALVTLIALRCLQKRGQTSLKKGASKKTMPTNQTKSHDNLQIHSQHPIEFSLKLTIAFKPTLPSKTRKKKEVASSHSPTHPPKP